LKVLVVGAGFAGLSAALAARAAGASVTIAHAGAGASALYAGVVDGSLAGLDGPAAAVLKQLTAALGLRLSETTVIATREGVLRPSAGADSALLDLEPLAGKWVGVVDTPRDDWDGDLLASAFTSSPWARATGTRFEAVSVDLLEHGHERRIAAFDFAARFDQAERLKRLAGLLTERAGPAAWLLGPWLGIDTAVSTELSSLLGVPLGEVTSPPGGAAGGRFERRRDALFASLSLVVVGRRVVGVAESETTLAVRFDDGGELCPDALVLASGGFVSGAVRLTGALSGETPAGFELGISGLPTPQLLGQPPTATSSLFSVDFSILGARSLERVGLPVTTQGRVLGMRRVYAAGDAVCHERPSAGFALRSGLVAGAAAASA